MTFCAAWKKEKKIYMIADSAVSEINDDEEPIREVNTFGEIQKVHKGYLVQEGCLKIIKIRENIVLSFSGNIGIAEEILKYIDECIDLVCITDCFEAIKNTYSHRGTEMIFVICKNSKSSIYHFDEENIREVDSVEIGNGKNIYGFSEDFIGIVNEFYDKDMDANDYLAMIIGIMQCYILRNRYFKDGVGGVISGIFVDSKVKWFRDIEYYIYNNDIRECQTMSVIGRRDSVFSSSDISKGALFMLNPKMKNIIENKCIEKAIIKTLDTKNPFYYVLYNQSCNMIGFIKSNGESQNSLIMRWMKRGEEKTDYVYAFNPVVSRALAKYNMSKERLPSVIVMSSIKIPYIEHDDAKKMSLPEDVKRVKEQVKVDFDFYMHENKSQHVSRLCDIKKDISNYRNIMVIDFEYLWNVFKEITDNEFIYNEVENIFIEKVTEIFPITMDNNNFNEYKIFILKRREEYPLICGISLEKEFSRFNNCCLIDTNSLNVDLCNIVFEIVRNYYINEAFFHINKLIILADDFMINNQLIEILPEFNFISEDPDVFLVRNFNAQTHMHGKLRYRLIDDIVIRMLGMTMDRYAELEYISELNGNKER